MLRLYARVYGMLIDRINLLAILAMAIVYIFLLLYRNGLQLWQHARLAHEHGVCAGWHPGQLHHVLQFKAASEVCLTSSDYSGSITCSGSSALCPSPTPTTPPTPPSPTAPTATTTRKRVSTEYATRTHYSLLFFKEKQ